VTEHTGAHGPSAHDPITHDRAAHDDAGLFTGELFEPIKDVPPPTRSTRSQSRNSDRRRRHKRHRRVFFSLGAIIVVLVVLASVVIFPKLRDHFHDPDYAGAGSGSVTVVIGEGASATDIGSTLAQHGVVKSAAAFISAANNNPDSQKIQPGTYTLHAQMSAASALTLLLNSEARVQSSDLVVIEGATTLDIEERMVKALGESQRPQIEQALKDVADAGLPLGYAPDGSANGLPSTLEGFLYPATYNVGENETPPSIIGKMTGAFIAQDRQSGFALGAKALNISPYEALIIASLAQSEAKFPDDMAKVARVILNRLASQRKLQIDAATVYGAKLNGVDPTTIDYTSYDTPYNTYLHDGLPPTPISNPGADALQAAIHPTPGNWIYYVNDSADGHLYFTNNEDDFNTAVDKCRNNNWGCA
jgi:UPF0755 protein